MIFPGDFLSAVRLPRLMRRCGVIALAVGYALLPACRRDGRPDGSLRHIPMVKAPTDGEYVVGRRVARLSLPGSPRNFIQNGPALYVLQVEGGMSILDISNPDSPRIVGPEAPISPGSSPGAPPAVDPTRTYFAGLAEPTRLLLADHLEKSIDAFDAGDPFHPRLAWQRSLPGEGPVGIAHALGGYYVPAAGSGLYYFPDGFGPETTPTQVLAQFEAVKQAEFMPPHWLLLADNYVGGLRVLSLARPSQPRFVRGFATDNFVDALASFDGFAVLCNRNRGTLFVDLSDPARPFVNAVFAAQSTESVRCVARWGEQAALVGYNVGFFDVFGLRDPRRPVWLGRIVTGAFVRCLAVRGDDVFVGLAVPPSKDPGRPSYQLLVFHLERRLWKGPGPAPTGAANAP